MLHCTVTLSCRYTYTYHVYNVTRKFSERRKLILKYFEIQGTYDLAYFIFFFLVLNIPKTWINKAVCKITRSFFRCLPNGYILIIAILERMTNVADEIFKLLFKFLLHRRVFFFLITSKKIIYLNYVLNIIDFNFCFSEKLHTPKDEIEMRLKNCEVREIF